MGEVEKQRIQRCKNYLRRQELIIISFRRQIITIQSTSMSILRCGNFYLGLLARLELWW